MGVTVQPLGKSGVKQRIERMDGAGRLFDPLVRQRLVAIAANQAGAAVGKRALGRLALGNSAAVTFAFGSHL